MQHHHLTREQWDAVALDPDFQELMRARRRFIVPATIFFIVFYFALPVSVGFAPSVMSRPFLGPLTLAYTFALSQFVTTWLLLAIYMRRAKQFDRMAERLVERARSEIAQ